MFLLSRKKLNTGEVLNMRAIKSTSNFLLLDSHKLDFNIFFQKLLCPLINLESLDFEPADNMFTTAYKIKESNMDFAIVEKKIDITTYILDILNSLQKKKFDFYNYTPAYIAELIELNNELGDILNTHIDIISNIFENSLNESIYSISSIRKCIELSPNILPVNSSRIGDIIKSNLTDTCFLSESLLKDLIYVGKATKSYDTTSLAKRLHLERIGNRNKNPFY